MKPDNIISEICRLTGMSETMYGELLFDNGMRFLESECNRSNWDVSVMSQQSIFWAWYRNLYYKFDRELSSEIEQMTESRHELQCFYKQAHEDFCFYFPDWIRTGYMHMVSKVISNERRERSTTEAAGQSY